MHGVHDVSSPDKITLGVVRELRGLLLEHLPVLPVQQESSEGFQFGRGRRFATRPTSGVVSGAVSLAPAWSRTCAYDKFEIISSSGL